MMVGCTHAVQPDGNLVSSILVRARKEPEVKLACLIRFVANGQQTSVAFADVEIDFRYRARGAVYDEFCSAQ